MKTVWVVVAALLCGGATLGAAPVRVALIVPLNLALDEPLVDAVRRGDSDAVRALLDSGADVDSTTPDGATALLWAVHTDQPELVRLLLEAGADVGIANRYGVGPASLAAENGNAAILEWLLEAGVDADHTPPGGETLLVTAARTGEPETVRTLLAHGADPNLRETTRGQTPLMWAAANNNAAAIQLLAEQGADINAKTDNPSRGSDRTFSYAPPTGFSSLMFAVRAGHMDATRVLLDAGADVNDTVSDGQSLLVVAAANANWELAAYLLDRGADVTRAQAGWNALHQTVRTRRMNVAFGTPGPFSSGTLDSIDLMRRLLDAGVDVNARMTRNGMRDGQRNRLNRLGSTAFMLAAKVTDVEAMRLLLDAGADPTVPAADGTTPLMVAAGLAIWNPGEDGGSLTGQEEEVLEAVRICLEGGNDVNARNYRGETALHGVAFRGVNIVLDYLVEQGADLAALTDDGWSALAIARGLSYTDFYKAQVHTAARLEQLMQARGLGTKGVAHRVPGSVCYDCLQTRRDQTRAVAERDEWMEANFDPASHAIQMMPGWSSLPFPPAAEGVDETVNRVIERLRQGRPAIGTFTRTARPELDFAIIDEQYGEFDIDAVREALAGMRSADGAPVVAPIVRIPLASRDAPGAVVKQLLDIGVFGVMFPDIETKEQAVTAISSMRFADAADADDAVPAGLRGSGSGSAPGYWGLSEDDYRASADVWPLDPSGKLVAMLQIESLAGIENLDEILDVPGIGVIFLGPTDLAISAGEQGPNSPRVEELVQEVLAACLARNVPCGYPIVARTAEDAERETARRLAEGFQVLAVMTTAR